MNRTSSVALGLPLLALVGLPACGGGGLSMVDDGPGIETVNADTTGTTGTGGETTADPDTSSGGPVSSCENGLLDEDESDVDCGGACDPCGPGGQCSSAEDCDTMICSGGFCQTPTCYDGMQNGSEEGVDCGGSCPNDCLDTTCQTDNQCAEGEFCLDGECTPSSCENGMQDTLESDVDCGGSDCPDCTVGEMCDTDADCDTQVCGDDGLCAAAACDDVTLNGDESDVDCGGSCPPCPNGGSCQMGSDCVEGVCDNGTCVDDNCIDMVENGNETDVDCGGPQCLDCPDGFGCNVGGDCQSGVCMGGVCVGALCDDMVQNGDETDVDCGGACGATCVPGQDCGSSADCVENVCEFGQCSLPDCSDGVQNGNESDMDCGGTCGATCIPGEGCSIAGDCTEGVCAGGLCSAPSCVDGVENGDETDLDCGGACGATCNPMENCSNGGDCVTGVCVLGVCQSASCNDGVQNGIEQGIDCAGVCSQPCPVGNELTVNSTLPDFQVQPAVATPPNGGYSVVAWASFPVANPPQDGNGAGVYVRVYNAAGTPITGEVLANASTLGNQAFPAVDAYNGGFVVAWQGPDGDGNGIYAQRFNSVGTPQGGEITVNATLASEQRRPDVAVRNDGTFVVCWESETLTPYDILCRRFSALGVALGGEQVVNTVTTDSQNLAVVEVADNGEYTVVWQSAGGQDGDSVGVFMRRFTAAGAAIGAAESQVNSFNTLDQQGPAIGMNGTGSFVVGWSSDGQDGSNTGVFARRYNAAGTAQGGEFQVNTTTAGAQNNPAIAVNGGGDFIIAWQTADDGVLTGVFAQRYDQAGVPFNVEFTVNPTTLGLQEEPDVAVRGANEVIGVWSDGDVGFTNRDVRRQAYDAQFP